MQSLALNDIRIDGGTQARNQIDSATVGEYAELYAADIQLPPVVVFHDGKDYWMGDGFHRFHAARRAGRQTLDADVRPGTIDDARWFAVGANRTHGLRRTNQDKRRAVELALSMHPERSDRQLAEHVGVNDKTIATVRAELVQVRNSAPGQAVTVATSKREGRDGKQYPAPPPPIPDPPRTALAPPPPGQPPPPAVTPSAPAAAVPEPAPPPERKPDEPHGRDAVERVIPDVCSEVFGRAHEAKRLLAAVSEVRVALRRAVQAHDPLYAEVNASAVLAELDRAYDLLAVAVPYAVCPSCQGNAQLTGCRLCSGRGAISRFKWDTCVPEETKRRIGGLRK